MEITAFDEENPLSYHLGKSYCRYIKGGKAAIDNLWHDADKDQNGCLGK